MADPSIDRDGEPFCYFSKPTDVIGVMDGPEGTLVTPEGYLYTGYAELMFFTGNPPVPVYQRIKTLHSDRYPIVQYSFLREGIEYRIQVFAATLSGNPEDPLINFVRASISNPSSQTRTAWFGAGVRYQNEEHTDWKVGDNRFIRPATATSLGGYEQEGVAYSREWEYAYTRRAVVRDGRAIFFFPQVPPPERYLTWKTGYNEPRWEGPQSMDVLPTTPVGNVLYRIPLSPTESTVLDFYMPYTPIDTNSNTMDALVLASFDAYHKKTVMFWDSVYATGLAIVLPESKVVHVFDMSLVYALIARDKLEGWYVQKVNEFQYDAFWLRDASHIVRMYDISGYHDVARQCLAFFPRWQTDDGNFLSQGGQYDGWGQVLWAYGQHFRLTHDSTFALQVFPSIHRAVGWLRTARRGDSLHLLPVTTPGDNEDITGHVTGHNFWALAGLKNAISLAQGIDMSDDATLFRREYHDYLNTFMRRLRQLTHSTGGYIPPGLDTLGGQDWGNMLGVYPEVTLDPHDPMVTATLATTRAKYQEGLMTYGDGRWLHHYLTMKNTETSIVRGDQRDALEELYAVLVHTSSTHAGFEFSILPWGTRDFGMNLAPHGWFAAMYRTMLRNMLVREQGNSLHLLSALSPAWLKPGSPIKVLRAPTDFGFLEFSLNVHEGGARLELTSEFHTLPDSLIVHIPCFVHCTSVTADGTPVRLSDGSVCIPAESRTVQFAWTGGGDSLLLSYDRSVTEFRKEYRSRYERYKATGLK